jgi:hypothetical protein
MLDVSRIILGKFQIDLHPIHLAEVVEAAVTTARPDAAKAPAKGRRSWSPFRWSRLRRC